MKKCDLKTGMIVKLEKYSTVYMVILDSVFGDILLSNYRQIPLYTFNDDLRSLASGKTDIDKVYQIDNLNFMDCHDIFNCDFDWIVNEAGYMKLIWERK